MAIKRGDQNHCRTVIDAIGTNVFASICRCITDSERIGKRNLASFCAFFALFNAPYFQCRLMMKVCHLLGDTRKTQIGLSGDILQQKKRSARIY